jgi:hypothetical protein
VCLRTKGDRMKREYKKTFVCRLSEITGCVTLEKGVCNAGSKTASFPVISVLLAPYRYSILV